jgi:hypothetical protein
MMRLKLAEDLLEKPNIENGTTLFRKRSVQETGWVTYMA